MAFPTSGYTSGKVTYSVAVGDNVTSYGSFELNAVVHSDIYYASGDVPYDDFITALETGLQYLADQLNGATGVDSVQINKQFEGVNSVGDIRS